MPPSDRPPYPPGGDTVFVDAEDLAYLGWSRTMISLIVPTTHDSQLAKERALRVLDRIIAVGYGRNV